VTLEWVATAARTGRVIADLPLLSVPQVGAVLGGYTTAQGTLPVGGTGVGAPPEAWLEATLHGGATLVLLDDGVPVWGGLVKARRRNSGDVITLSLATLEAYFDGRFVGDKTYTATGQNAIVADLIASYVVDGVTPGLPIRVDGGTGGTARDRAYTDEQDKTVLSVLTELSSVTGGPEWTIGWEHQSSPERYTPVLFVGDRIGVSPSLGLAPAAMFDLPGCVSFAELVEDFSAGKGATDVMATSTAVADVRPQSPHQLSGDSVRPSVEFRFTPSTSITVVDTLTAHAARVVAAMGEGARALSLTADLGSAPRLGRDWAMGDDVGYAIGGVEDDPTRIRTDDGYSDTYDDVYGETFWTKANPAGRESVPAFPGGLVGVGRAVGWSMTLPEAGVVGKVSPVLVLSGGSV